MVSTESVSTAPDLFGDATEFVDFGAMPEVSLSSSAESGAVDLTPIAAVEAVAATVAPAPVDPIAAALQAYDALDAARFAAARGGWSWSWYGLDLSDRAAALGIGWRELSMIAGSGDIRIIAKPALSTPEAVFRLRRWFALGRPDADPTRIAFVGSDSVRALVIDVLRQLPVPVRHYAVHHVTWREVGRDAKAFIAATPTKRALPGDAPHEITINGMKTDEELPGLICHELGHGIHRVVYDGDIEWSCDPGESLADRIRRGAENNRERWLYEQVRHEMLADDMAALWGFGRLEAPSEDELYRQFAFVWDEAADLAARPTFIAEIKRAPGPELDEIERALDRAEAGT